jgi:hypothetical protein
MMKRFKFIMEDKRVIDIVAPDFRTACMIFDQLDVDPRKIEAVESRTGRNPSTSTVK